MKNHTSFEMYHMNHFLILHESLFFSLANLQINQSVHKIFFSGFTVKHQCALSGEGFLGISDTTMYTILHKPLLVYGTHEDVNNFQFPDSFAFGVILAEHSLLKRIATLLNHNLQTVCLKCEVALKSFPA